MKDALSRMALLSVLGSLAIAAGGCGSAPAPVAQTPPTTPAATTTGSSNDVPDPTKYTDAGIEVKGVPQTPMTLANLAAAKYGPPRSDPFALKASEREYDADQAAERVFSDIGGFQNEFTPSNPFEGKPVPPIEPQPYRRLAGIVVGDSIVALITMEDNNSYIIYPGEQLPAPYSEWTVKSINLDEAVLERTEGNPKEVTVRLELPPAGSPMNGAGGPPMGGPPGGMGGPPGGIPGAPGGGFRPGGFGGGK